MPVIQRTHEHPLLGKHLLIIVAHPDDEAYLVSGTSYENAKAGGRTTVLCATLGEKGSSHLAKPVSETQLKRIRKQELLRATKHAKIHRLHMLRFPDGRVREHQTSLSKQCLNIARKTRPDVVISFGPDGWTGHRDHIATYYAAVAVAKQLSLPHFVATPAPHRHAAAKASALRGQVNPHYDRIVPYRTATTSVRIPKQFKETVLSFYPSQIPRVAKSAIKKSRRTTRYTREYFAEIPQAKKTAAQEAERRGRAVR